MTITAEVKGCTISLRQPPLAGGTVGDVTVEFHFDEVWNGYTRTAVFRAHGKTVLMLHPTAARCRPRQRRAATCCSAFSAFAGRRL